MTDRETAITNSINKILRLLNIKDNQFFCTNLARCKEVGRWRNKTLKKKKDDEKQYEF